MDSRKPIRSTKYPFEDVYTWLKEYKEEFGDLNVSTNYVRKDGIRLGQIVSWIRTGSKRISPEEREKLNQLGFIWRAQARKNLVPMKVFIEEFTKYKEDHNGKCNVPLNYVTPSGFKLGYCVSYIRYGRRILTDAEKKELDNLGFVWKSKKERISMDDIINLIKEYVNEHGDCLIPLKYVTPEGVKLGSIVRNIRRSGARHISSEDAKRLSELGFNWNMEKYNKQTNFDKLYMYLKEYKEKYGDLHIPANYITENGIKLGHIVRNIKYGRRILTDAEKKELDNLGFVWETRRYISIDDIINLIKEYVNEHGDCLIPSEYVTPEGVKLGSIVRNIRSGTRHISSEDAKRLNELGFNWNMEKHNKQTNFDKLYMYLKEYKEKYGNLHIPANYITEDGIKLGSIVCSIKNGTKHISPEDAKRLSELGFNWNRNKRMNFDRLYMYLREYKEKYGDLYIPANYITENGIKLGSIVANIRYGRRSITVKQKEELDALGFIWPEKKKNN